MKIRGLKIFFRIEAAKWANSTWTWAMRVAGMGSMRPSINMLGPGLLLKPNIRHHGQAQDFISFTACLSTRVSSSEEASTTGGTMERGAVAAGRRHLEDVAAMAAGASTRMVGAGDDGDELQVEWWIRETESGKTLAQSDSKPEWHSEASRERR